MQHLIIQSFTRNLHLQCCKVFCKTYKPFPLTNNSAFKKLEILVHPNYTKIFKVEK